MTSVKEWEGFHNDPPLLCCAAFGSGASSSYNTSTPEENCQDFSKPNPKRDPIDNNNNNNNNNNNTPIKEKKQRINGKMSPLKGRKNNEFRKPVKSQYQNNVASNSTWVCRNLACKNNISSEESFCKRCSCCLCHRFDDNKDPSLWVECSSEEREKYSDHCGASCHVECAIQKSRIGCVAIGEALNIDGSYCCASCGKVSGILRFWRRQLEKAKEARRVDILCHRIFIAFKLLNKTTQFKELYDIINEAKGILETEVGPLDGVSAKMARGIVSRLHVNSKVQGLCSLGVEKVNELIESSHFKDSLPAACKFKFEKISHSSLVIILRETPSPNSQQIKGYKLWFWKNRAENSQKGPHFLQKFERRVFIDNLDPCSEYMFRVISFSEDGDLGHSESSCFTKSVEFLVQSSGTKLRRNRDSASRSFRSSGFKIRNIGKILRRAWAEDGYFQDIYSSDQEQNQEENQETKKDSSEDEELQNDPLPHQLPRQHSVSRHLDLNLIAVPDLNMDADDSGVDSHTNENLNSNLNSNININENENENENENLNGSLLDEDYEYCVKVIRWLECSGYIDKGFRMRFLTWFSLGSGIEERRVVLTFIKTLIDDPISLGTQLEDSFMDVVSRKKTKHEFCTKLWH